MKKRAAVMVLALLAMLTVVVLKAHSGPRLARLVSGLVAASPT